MEVNLVLSQEWPQDALLAVATHFLKDVDLTDTERNTAIYMCQKYHTDITELSIEFKLRFKRHNYVTPTAYLELVSLFKKLLTSKRLLVNTVLHSCYFSVSCEILYK